MWFRWASLLLLAVLGLPGCSGGDCRYDTDCPDNKICKRGICTSNLLGVACSTDSECGSGETCIASSCIKVECKEGAVENCFEGPPGSQNVGICRGGTRTCKGRRWSACNGQVLPVLEVCNQIDDDCNGQVDDDASCASACQTGATRSCYTGPPGTQNIGICRPGSESCVNNKWSGQCVGETKPASSEKCEDNQDNNCNGQTDENCGPCRAGDSRDCYTGPAPTRSVGACKPGKQTCQSGQWGVCAGEVKPTQEVCDNQDNDCNGKIDDSPNCQKACNSGSRRDCYNGPAGTKGVGACRAGVELCVNGQWGGSCQGAVVPSAEKCDDRIDNNCNGQVDENCGVCRSGDQEVCFSGTKGCTKQPDGSFRCNQPCRAGIRSCQGGQWTSCQNEVKPKASETCGNQVDDDCNGKVDDGCGVCRDGLVQVCYNGPPGTVGVGVCRGGKQTCSGGNWGTCQGEVNPGPEQCGDNQDNNCNGQVDENCQTQGKLHKPCTSNTDCDSGQTCINFQGQSQGACFQTCTASAGTCTRNSDGRTKCVDFARTQNNQTIRVCVREANTGSTCDVTKSVICKQGDVCASGKCTRATTVSEGGQCDAQSSPPKVCGANLLCVGFGTGFPSICLKVCTPGTSTCGSGFSCVALSSGSGACIQSGCTSNSQCRYPGHVCQAAAGGGKSCFPEPLPGPLTFGKVCDPTKTSTRCVRGLTCLGLQGATKGFCTKDCTSSPSCPSSPSGSRCTTINTSTGVKMCLFPTCSSCPSGLKCSTSVQYCFP